MDHKKHRSLALPLGSLFFQLLWKTKTRTQRWASWHVEPVTMWWLLKQGCLSSSDLNIPLLMWMFWRRQSWSLPSIETPFHAETFWHFKQFFKNWKSFSSATVDSVLCYLLAEWGVYADGKTTLVCIKHHNPWSENASPQGRSHLYIGISAPVVGWLGPPGQTVLSVVLCLGVSTKARTRAICLLGCLPPPLSKQVY